MVIFIHGFFIEKKNVVNICLILNFALYGHQGAENISCPSYPFSTATVADCTVILRWAY